MDDETREKFTSRLRLFDISEEAITQSLELSDKIHTESRPDHDLGVRLTRLIAPFLDGEEDLYAMQMLCAFATNAWNITLMPPEERDAFIAFFIRTTIDKSDDGFLEALTKDLIAVKCRLYPDDMRFISDCDVTQDGSRFTVTASVGPEYMSGPG